MIIFKKEIHTEKYHPQTVAGSREFKAIAKAENQEFEDYGRIMQLIIDNFYIQTLTQYGLEQWEKILEIVPWATDTIEQRREAVEIALKSQLPYTLRQLKIILENICGENGYILEVQNNNYQVTVLVALGSKRTRGLVGEMLEQVLPANLNYNVDLLYNRHIDIEPYTHEYLSEKTHNEIYDEPL